MALGRKIVVKMLPSDSAGAVSVERFRREIQIVARLQHPHIVPVLSAGHVGDLPFYTMPFVKGESLRARLQRSQEMSVNEALHVLRDVAAALAYAHGEGVVHRDIKPDNVIVSGGVAVVTDFGVSKAVDVAATDAGVDLAGITSLGIALGTPAYMAPEQASADPHVDHRADIYSFGCLAYELLAGTSPFAGRTPQQMLAAHVTDTPESLLKRRPNVPPALASLVMKCLEKRAGDRPQTADELLNSLDAIATTPSGGSVPTAERLRSAAKRPRSRWMVAGGILALLALGGIVWQRATAFVPVAVGATTPVAIGSELEGEPAISPDGKLVAFASTTPVGVRIFVRQMDGGGARMLTGDMSGNHRHPKWSPDGSRLSFAADGAVFVVPALTGGSPKRTIENADTHSWSPDGKSIVYATPEGRFVRLQPLDGGPQRTLVEGATLHSPVISPNGKILLYNEGQMPSLSNLSVNRIWSVPVAGGTRTRLSDSTHVNLSPVWMPDGKSLLFISDLGGARDVYQLPLTSAGRTRGTPVRLTTNLSSYWISLSGDGSRMAYDAVRNYSNIYVAPLQNGSANLAAAQPITQENQHVEIMGLSHDGKWIAYDSDRGGNFDIYKQRVEGGEPIQLTTNPAQDFSASWSPDDKEIAFHSTRNGTRDIYVINGEGTNEQQVTSGPGQDFLPDWSPDGKSIVYYRASPIADTIFIVTRDASGKWSAPKPLAHFTANPARVVKWSPDGKSIAASVHGKLMLYSPDGRTARVLTDLGSVDVALGASGIAWSRNSSIVFTSSELIQDVKHPGASRSTLEAAFAAGGATTGAAGSTAIYAIPVSSGTPRLVVADNPNVRFARFEIAVDDKRLFFTRAAWESNVWMMELKH
jgi:Tol biopolymer transport system component